jgi:hypothetical protein
VLNDLEPKQGIARTKITTTPEDSNNTRTGIVDLPKIARSAARSVNSVMTAEHSGSAWRSVKVEQSSQTKIAADVSDGDDFARSMLVLGD